MVSGYALRIILGGFAYDWLERRRNLATVNDFILNFNRSVFKTARGFNDYVFADLKSKSTWSKIINLAGTTKVNPNNFGRANDRFWRRCLIRYSLLIFLFIEASVMSSSNLLPLKMLHTR